jgi:hypothetical protein
MKFQYRYLLITVILLFAGRVHARFSLPVMVYVPEMCVMEMLHEHDHKDQEDQQSADLIKEGKYLIHRFWI